MNLFNPKGQKQLTHEFEVVDVVQNNGNIPQKSNRGGIDQITNIMREEGGQVRMKNATLQKKTEDVQNEFEKLMNEMVNRRSKGLGVSNVNSDCTIDDLLDKYYLPGPERKHKSPTKRLISHKNSTTDHKQKIYNGIVNGTVQRGEYSQTYCISPGKTYVIEAQGGELPYNIAETQPQLFYSTVLNQDIFKCKVQMRGLLKFELTQRPLLKIITSIKDRLIWRIEKNIGTKYRDDIRNAFAPGGIIEGKLMDLVENDQVELIGENKELLVKQQISLLSQKQQQMQLNPND